MPQILGREVGPTGFGLMGLTWRTNPPPKTQAFSALRTALSLNSNFWNGGEFYGTPENNSLTLLESYFTTYPEDAERVVLSIKGCYVHNVGIDGSASGVRKSMDNILSTLTRKRVDIFECGRRDPKVPLSETFSALQEYIDRGQLGGISLSEVRAETIHEAVRILGSPQKIAFVENELSLFVTDPLSNGVVAACAQYGIPLVAYSPIGRGILGGNFKTAEDVPEHLQMIPRYYPENFEHNLQLFNLVNELAEKKGCTPAQLALSWVRSLS
ncbi:pyridoxal reductase [Cladorrhinum sp. PSN332]|nr:pyridoxal reductase [Cladorrhinum sp. PSN332]